MGERAMQCCRLFDRQMTSLHARWCFFYILYATPNEIGPASAVRHQTACEYVYAIYKYPGNSVAFKKVNDLADLQIEEWISSRHQRVGTLAQYAPQVRVEI